MNRLVLVDTSIWTDHFRHGDDGLAALVEHDALLLHPFVAAELALITGLGGTSIRDALTNLRTAPTLPDAAMLAFAAEHALADGQVGFVDMHLLASTAQAGARLWTRESSLVAQAERLGLGYQPR